MVTRMPRRSSAALVAVALVTTVLLGVVAQAGHATASFAFSRYAGDNRYDTAAKIATSTFTTADTVVVASGDTYPDALAGAYAAGLASVPVLLVTRDDVPTSTRSALITLKSTKALIVGGTGVVGTAAEQVLKSLGLATTRISGTSRYDTAKA